VQIVLFVMLYTFTIILIAGTFVNVIRTEFFKMLLIVNTLTSIFIYLNLERCAYLNLEMCAYLGVDTLY